MADTYNIGDAHEVIYPDAPRSKEKQYQIGQQVLIKAAGNLPLAIWEVEKSDETGAEGKIIRVFKAKIPIDPRRTKPL